MHGEATVTNAVTTRYVVDIYLTTQQLKSFYAGDVSQVSARDRRGLRLQFPLSSLRQFVDHHGVQGTFEISVNARNQLCRIKKF